MDKTTFKNNTYLQLKIVYDKDVDNSTSTLNTESKTIIPHNVTN